MFSTFLQPLLIFLLGLVNSTKSFLNTNIVIFNTLNTPGWAYDLKTVPANLIENRVIRTGDGSHRNEKMISKTKESMNQDSDTQDNNSFWGYGDKEMTEEDMKKITIIRKLHG